MATLTRVATAVAAAVLAGCSEHASSSEGRGTIVISTGADADHLFPALAATTVGKSVTDQIFEPLAAVGDSLNVIGDEGFQPRLADSWTWAPDSLSIAFHLNPRARWHDGAPVRASDVRYTFRLYTDSTLASPSATLLANIDSVTIRDSLTPVVWLHHRATDAFYTAADEMGIVPEHVYGKYAPAAIATADVARHPVGSGRFRFSRWVAGSTIELVSNPAHYRAPAQVDRVIWTIAPDQQTALTRLLAGDADFLENVRPEAAGRVAATPSLRLQSTQGFRYSFLAFNLRDPHHPSAPNKVLGDRAVRRALTMATDRAAIVRNVFDSLAAPSLGPFLRAMPTTPASLQELPYDPTAAARTLDSLGWHADPSTGMRRRNGAPLTLAIVTPASSQDRQRMAVLLQAQLRRVGVAATVQPLELNAFMRTQSARDFDSAIEGYVPDPNPAAIREQWGSASAAEHGSANYAGYGNPRFDALIDSASRASTLAAARPFFARAYQLLIDDAPAIWLAEPRTIVGVHRRIHIPALRSDAWWANLADWSIPPSERIARDRLRPASAGQERAAH